MNEEHVVPIVKTNPLAVTAAPQLAEMLNDSSIDRVMAIDSDWNIISWNKTSEIITGLQRAELLGKNWLQVFPGLKEDLKLVQAVEAAFTGLKSFLPADKKISHRQLYENHIIPLFDADKKVIGVMIIMHDVSHRIKAEQQLQQLNQTLEKKYRELEMASNELSTFTIITSTSIKEPVRHIYTGLEFLVKSEGRNLTDAGKASLRRMQSSLNRMNLLLNDILTFSQINNPDGALSTIDIRDALQQAIDKLETKIQETGAAIGIAGTWEPIQGHPEHIQLLFFHLLDNAIKFQPAGRIPKITITGENYQFATGTRPEYEGKTYQRVSFSDNGIGFISEDSSRIFSLFEKLHGNEYRGSGMGLAISRKIMEIHDGFIQTESTPGEGSVFNCYFPLNL